MNIEKVEDKLQNITDTKYLAIITLIVNAIRDYPLYEMHDTIKYFEEIKRLLKVDQITITNLRKFVDENRFVNGDNNLWVITSLSSLIEAFDLMLLYKIEFSDVIKKIES